MTSRNSKHDGRRQRAHRKPAGGRPKSSARAAKAKKKPAGGGAEPREPRLDRFIKRQRQLIKTVSDYAIEVADSTSKGQFSASKWIQQTATMWQKLADDVAEMTKIVLKD
jgi:hypothetical protein